jgi:hypothetical protein
MLGEEAARQATDRIPVVADDLAPIIDTPSSVEHPLEPREMISVGRRVAISRRNSYVKELETSSQFNQMKGCLN